MNRERIAAALTTSLPLILMLLLLSAPARAQSETSQYDHGTPPQHAAGVSQVGSYLSTDLGTINLSNGSLNFRIPVGSVGGRGFWLPLSLNYSSKVWSARTGIDSAIDATPTQAPAAFAVYDDPEAPRDAYQKVAPGWTLGAVPTLQVKGVGITQRDNPPCGAADYQRALTKLTLIMPDKGEVELRDDYTDGSPLGATAYSSPPCLWMDGNRGTRWHASDGSGIVFISDSPNGVVNGDLNGWLVTSDGTRYRFRDFNPYFGGSVFLNEFARATSVIDRNGNRVQIAYSAMTVAPYTYAITFTDQLGRQTSVKLNAADPADPGQVLAALVDLPGYSGARRYYKVKAGVMNQNYRAGLSPQLPVINGDMDGREGYYGWTGPHTSLFPSSWGGQAEQVDSRQVLTQLVLPDGRALQFRYNEYGEVAEFETPAGGKVRYDYAYDPADGLPTGNSLSFEVHPMVGDVRAIDRAVVARRVYPEGETGGAAESYWTYDYSASRVGDGLAAGGTTEVIARSSDNATVVLRQRHYFMDGQRFLTSKGGTGYTSWSTGLERRSEMLNAAGTAVIAGNEDDWTQRAPVVWSFGYATEQIANDNRVNESRRYLDDGKVARTTYLYDQFNNQTEAAEYDYDNTLKRRTVTSYSAVNPVGGVNYAADSIRLLRLPLQQSVYDAAGAEQARTAYEYDVYTADADHASLEAYAGFSVTGHDTDNYGAGRSARGNRTGLGRWLKSSNSYLYSYSRYDILGNVVSIKDANKNVSYVGYADDFGDGSNPGGGTAGAQGPTFACPTLLTSPPPNAGEQPHTARSQWDYSTGLPTGFRDRNNVVTQTIYNDPFDRPTLIKAALGVMGVEAHTAMFYAPATVYGVTLTKGDVLTAKDLNTTGGGAVRNWTRTDGFGRTTEGWTRDPQGDVQVVTAYDALGRAAKLSYPLRPSRGETPRYTTTSYDLLGRVVSLTTPDAASVTTSYSGNRVTVTDQAGRKRRSVTDALGRLVRVDEPDAVSGNLDDTGGNPVQPTFYAYDVLDSLRKIEQGGQLRFFACDSLGRLIRAKNPEQGEMAADADFPALTDSASGQSNSQWSVGYLYDANGNLLKRKDARGVTATYAYDALNRNKSIDYSDSTPDVTRTYDGATFGKGRLWKSETWQGALTVVDGYDEAGRLKQQTQKFWAGGAWGQAFTTQFAYNLAGGVTSETYPSGHSVSYNYDSAGRLSDSGGQPAFGGNLGDGVQRTYASEVRYHASGSMEQERYGTDTPVYNKRLYNGRGQLAEIRVSTYGLYAQGHETDWNRGAIINHYSKAPGAWGATGGGADNNGNLLKQEVYVPNDDAISGYFNVVQYFGYDALNRLTSVEDKPSNASADFTQTYRYDRWGNRTINSSGTSNAPAPQFAVDQATNRLGVPAGQAGQMTYDPAGNLTYDSYQGGQGGGGSRTYDAENRMTSAQFVSGQAQTAAYAYDADGRRVKRNNGAGGEVWQVYGAGGELLAEYAAGAAPASPRKEYGYRGGELLVTAAPGAQQQQQAGGTPYGSAAAPIPGTVEAELYDQGGEGVGYHDTTPGSHGQDYDQAGYPPPSFRQPTDVDIYKSGGYSGGYLVVMQAGDWMGYTADVAQAGSYTLEARVAWGGCPGGTFHVEVDGADKTGPLRIPDTAWGFQTVTKAGVQLPPGRHLIRVVAETNAANGYTGDIDYVRFTAAGVSAPYGAAAAVIPGTLEIERYDEGGEGVAYHDLTAGNSGQNYNAGGYPPTAYRQAEGVDVYEYAVYSGGYLEMTQAGEWTAYTVEVAQAGSYTLSARVAWGGAGGTLGAFHVEVDGADRTGPLRIPDTNWALTEVTKAGVQLTQGRHVVRVVAETNAGNGYTGDIDSLTFTLTAAQTSGADVRWMVTDQVGTPRMVIDRTGSLAGVTRHDHLPFGGEVPGDATWRTEGRGYRGDTIRQKFTGKERDNETGLDYFLARYYANTQGRFTSPDPTLLSVNALNPQSWNRYTYVLNNPLVYVDPLGLWELYYQDLYKTKKNKDGTETKVFDCRAVFARKSKDGDDGASLAKQLGLKGKEADKFAAKIDGGDNVRLSDQGGDIGRVFKAVEEGLTSQVKWEASHPGQYGGPTDADCSETACRIAFPQQMFGTLTFSVQEADATISAEGATKSVQESDLRLGDIARFADARNNPQHFASFIFRGDDGVPIVFSKSGARGPYETATTTDARWARYGYGTIRGINKGDTGFYRPR